MIEKFDFSLLKRKLAPLLETGLTYKKTTIVQWSNGYVHEEFKEGNMLSDCI